MSHPTLSALSHRIEQSPYLGPISTSNILKLRRQIGWRLVTVKLLKDSFFEAAKELQCNLLIECGAHEAEVSNAFAHQTDCYSIAIEANPFTFDLKTQKAGNDRVRVFNYALSDEDGEIDFIIPTSSGDMSPGSASLLIPSTTSEWTSITVQSRRLDSLLDPSDFQMNSALWIDVEGASLSVLTGAKKYLDKGNCRLIFVEVEQLEFWESQSSLGELNHFLEKHGFVAVMRDAQTECQYNVIYVKIESICLLEDIIGNYWKRLDSITLSFGDIFPFTLRDLLSFVKKAILRIRLPLFQRTIHRFASYLGSKSSSRIWGHESEKS